ncbi:MAG: hypothetical protein QY320_13480 [Gammaproteobacteria bacterium]|nr:MAG: hypothetical protein QY320_13480 [Gammaproteobacteria bacterium]
MPTRSDFTTAQWRALRNAPQLVALATAAAGNSGLLGSLAEGLTAASAFAQATRASNHLITALFAREEIRAAHEDIQALLRPATDRTPADHRLQDAAIEATRAALDALLDRNATADADDFRKMLAWLAEKIANASKEGDFLGFGGERVSEGERKFLSRLYGVVGRPDAGAGS